VFKVNRWRRKEQGQQRYLRAGGARLYRSGFRTPQGREALENWYAEIMASSPTHYQVRDCPTRYGSTRVALGGNPNGEPLLLIHGWSGNGMLWEVTGSLEALAGRYRIYLLDVIGQPNHSSPLTPPVRGAGYGHWLVDVLDALGLERCSVVGMSFGGFLLVKLAQVSPDRVDRAVFLASAGFTGVRLRPRMVTAFGRAWLQPQRRNVAHFVHTNILGSTDRFNPEHLDRIVDSFHIAFRHFRQRAQPPYVYSDAELRAVSMPSLLLCGAEDALFSANKMVERAQRVLPALHQVRMLPGMGHALGNSEEVVQSIASFLESERRSTDY
jgi:pimeloyl-ACP methyl ester carboxylesterase